MSEFQPLEELLADRRSKVSPNKNQTPDEAHLTARDELILELVAVGVSVRKAEDLVARFPHERIRQQLAWLPARGARRPASLLIVAVERDFDAPAYGEK